MKIALLAAAATLAFAGAASAQTPGSWTGFYVGGYVGGSLLNNKKSELIEFDKNVDGKFGDTVLTSAGANAFSPGFCGGAAKGPTPASGCKDDKDGFAYGVHGGYDYQMPGTPYVVGLVAEFGESNVTNSVSAFSTTPAFYTITSKDDYDIAVLARAGRVFFGGNTLVYGTAGVAYNRIKNSFSTSNTANRFTGNGNDDAYGYKVGVGVEHRLTPKITIGLQYAFSNVDASNYRVRAGNTGATPATNPFLIANTIGTNFRRGEPSFEKNELTASLNYRF